MAEVPARSRKDTTVIGADFNADHLAFTKQLQVNLPLAVRNRSRHVWSKWAVVFRKTQRRPRNNEDSVLDKDSESRIHFI
jgi:hypothetical protein